MPNYRYETDSLGKVEVKSAALWGAQTQRSLENFTIGKETMPRELISAIALIKKSAASVHYDLQLMDEEKMQAISHAADEIIEGKWADEFPLKIWQTGSGTQTNMNVNEVIANRASELMGGSRGEKFPIHPNDHVNKSQSSNDVFPSAIRIAALLEIQKRLLPEAEKLSHAFKEKAEKFHPLMKVGRTHLMDAAPISLGQEFSAFQTHIEQAIDAIKLSLKNLAELALGGTAVGTGLNTPKDFGPLIAKKITEHTETSFTSAPNKFASLAGQDALLSTSAALKRLAALLFKIANDIRFYASGPRAGLQEIQIPANEPGSSIMPGKVNPTQCEAMTMVAIEVMSCEYAISLGGALGNFDLNVYQPLMGYNVLKAIELLSDGMNSFRKNCVVGITANEQRLKELIDNSLMLATALNPVIGYDKAAEVVKKAHKENISVKKAALSLGVASEEELDKALDPTKMVFR